MLIGTDLEIMASGFLYHSLENWLLQGIKQNRWQAGERLPSIRTLCKDKQLSKATVLHALQRLEAQGWLEARPKSGYFVKYQPKRIEQPTSVTEIKAPRPVNSSDLLLDIMQRSAAFDLCPNPESAQKSPGIIELNRCIGRALRQTRGGHHQYYDDPAGSPLLREQLAVHYARRGLPLSTDEICITSGCQHALFLALMACCEAGDTVAVESPGFYGALQLLEQLNLNVVEVPTTSENGLDLDAFQEVLERWPVKACIVSPAFSTPTGALLPESSREQLLFLCNQFDLAVIEDDIYADTAFGEVPDPLKAMDTENRVILCSSFSKSLSRDLRLGWISGGRWHAKIARLKLVTQLSSSYSTQRGVADFMTDGHFISHLRRQRNQLQDNRDFLISQIQQWDCQVRFSLPQGGLALWVELPEQVNTLANYHQLLEQGVVITPGPLFSVAVKYTNCLRLSFYHEWNEQRCNALALLPEKLLADRG